MSHIADKPIAIPSGVELQALDGAMQVKGPGGQLQVPVHASVQVQVAEQQARVSRVDPQRGTSAIAGTTRMLLANAVEGVTKGFERRLLIQGVGYRAKAQGQGVDLSLGFSHPVVFVPMEGVKVACASQTELVVSGIDKQKVGQVAAQIRAIRPPDVYRGKGVAYADERVRRKEAKKKK